ncbi:MAG TPA: hypothetical protein DCX54_07595 [Flavobacteriales bacterium]|nr:hypothetical protein [Flavobacteriales bacterium]
MKRALLPFIFAVSGLVLNIWASSMPLFEWQVGTVSEDYPPDYDVHLTPSPWITRLGQSLDDKPYISRKVFISIDQIPCWIEMGHKITIERSTIDKRLDLLSRKLNDFPFQLALGSLLLIGLSIIYMWWIIIWHEHRTIAEAVAITLIITFFFCFPIGMMRLLGPRISTDYFFAMCNEYSGTVSFSAEISKVHYETLITMLSAILAEFGALSKMIFEIVRTITRRKNFE